MNIQLLVIDPQHDFCHPKGALSVPGAEDDMKRLADMVNTHGDKIDDIRVTLDSHHYVHIAHPICWVDKNGNHPNPFTVITEADVTGPNPLWRAYNPGWQNRQVEYVKKLKEGGRYVLCIWPPHCLIGSNGHQVLPVFFDALIEWQKQFAVVDYVTKGSNVFTEHYSVVKADVPDPTDPGTNINTGFIQRLESADKILVAGEASSHCVRNSVCDIVEEFGEEHAQKFVILEDAMSPVPGFEYLHDEFFEFCKAKKINFSTTTTFFS